MRTKSTQLYDFSSQMDYDVFIIAETWLNENFLVGEFFNNNLYNVYRKDRSVDETGHLLGGGVLIAVNKKLKSFLCPWIVIENLLDQIFVNIQFNDYSICLGLSYIPPNSSYTLYSSHVDNVNYIYNKLDLNTHFCLFGDFNLSNIVWSQLEDGELIPTNVNKDFEIYLIDNFLEINLVQINNIFNKLNKILDLIFIPSSLKYSIYECLHPFSPLSLHHCALIIELQCYNFLKSSTNVKEKIFNFSLCNFDLLNSTLDNIDWSRLFLDKDTSDCYEIFLKNFHEICYKIIPLRRRTSLSHPWYTKGLKKLKNLRNSLHKRYLLTGSPQLYSEYMLRQKEFNFLNKFLYKQYIVNTENKIKSNPKSFWKFIKSKKQSSDIPSAMTYENNITENPQDIANMFADYFRSNFDNDSTLSSIVFDDMFSFDSYINMGQLFLSNEDFFQAINSLNNSLTLDADGLSAFLIKKCAPTVFLPLMVIFNKSLSEGVFIKKWKVTYITPIFKCGRKNNVECYRSIAKLTVISKIFERIVYSKLYFVTKQMIISEQHGFRVGKSTISNLVVFTDYCFQSMESGYQIESIYTDFSKAFDKVSHKILLKKLLRIGIHSNFLSWLSSYLQNRTCVVNVVGYKSAPYEQTSGIPQGSILGPLLFNIFINDICLCFKYSNYLLYADDLKIFLKIKTVNEGLKLQADLDRLLMWCVNNKLKLNFDKCVHVSYTHLRNPLQISFRIGCNLLKSVSEVNDLGILFDTKLSFIPHLESLIPKTYSLLAFIKRNCFNFSDPCTLKILYTSLIRSKLEYGSIVWSPYAKVHIDRLERIQRKFVSFALRNITFSYPLPPYAERSLLLGLETLELRRKIFSLSLIFDLINGNIDCPDLLAKIAFNVPCRNLRHHNVFFIQLHRSNFVLNSPFIRALTLFNKLSHTFNVEFSTSKHNFKSLLFYNMRNNHI